MFCTNCGKQISNGNYCPYCGFSHAYGNSFRGSNVNPQRNTYRAQKSGPVGNMYMNSQRNAHGNYYAQNAQFSQRNNQNYKMRQKRSINPVYSALLCIGSMITVITGFVIFFEILETDYNFLPPLDVHEILLLLILVIGLITGGVGLSGSIANRQF